MTRCGLGNISAITAWSSGADFAPSPHCPAWLQTAHIVGLPISDFSRYIIKQLAAEAHLQIVHITSVRRTVVDQARIFYNKHIVEGKVTKYKNPDVAKIVAHARELHAKGQAAEVIKIYLMDSIEHIHGGTGSVSRHLGVSPFSEVFDVAHYSGPTTGVANKLVHFLTRVEKRCLIR